MKKSKLNLLLLIIPAIISYLFEKEILLKEDVTIDWLNKCLESFKKANLDYLIIYFSGHGGSIRHKDFIELNKDGERIKFTKLEKIATRQLNIYDCCRASVDDDFSKNMIIFSCIYESLDEQINIRKNYEKRILQTKPQQMSLYSCSEEECSQDTGEDGLYTFNFL